MGTAMDELIQDTLGLASALRLRVRLVGLITPDLPPAAPAAAHERVASLLRAASQQSSIVAGTLRQAAQLLRMLVGAPLGATGGRP